MEEGRGGVMDKKIDNGGPAFPNPSGDDRDNNGMTLRDWFAGQALAGVSANDVAGRWTVQTAAAWSYAQADAMIEARKAVPHG
jgi:hypothetical protein